MNKKEKVLNIRKIFGEVYPEADCTLDYREPFQLLVATQLAAQCTDERVNKVTPALFRALPGPRDFAEADIGLIEELIKSTGFYHNKAKNLKACGEMLVEKYNGEVPRTMEELLELPGVGRKTANLLLGDAFGQPGIVVDTHAGRIARKIGLTKNQNPTKVEFDLIKIVPYDYRTVFCHQLVEHGRRVCKARSPKCDICPVSQLCDYFASR